MLLKNEPTPLLLNALPGRIAFLRLSADSLCVLAMKYTRQKQAIHPLAISPLPFPLLKGCARAGYQTLFGGEFKFQR